MRRLLAALLILFSQVTLVRADTLDNAGVIALSRAGLDDEVIIAKIKALPCGYDFSNASLVALRAAGVGQPVIVEMVRRCTGVERAPAAAGAPPPGDRAVRRAPGIYLVSTLTQSPLTMLRPAATVGLTYTGNGSFLFPYKATLTVTQSRAPTVARSMRPVFYFYFDPADPKPNTFGTPAGFAAQSPEEFSLVRFKVDGNIRQLMIGRRQPGLDAAGIDPKITLPFNVEETGDGSYRVTMPADLPPGQYGFVIVGETPRSKTLYRIYDFAVEPPEGTMPTVCVPPS